MFSTPDCHQSPVSNSRDLLRSCHEYFANIAADRRKTGSWQRRRNFILPNK